MKKKTFIIAEAGVNHNGSPETAMKLAEAALAAGADAVKFQTFRAEDLTVEKAQLEMLKGLELSDGDFRRLKAHCDEIGITFLSTPHTEAAIDFLQGLVPVYKVGSGDLNNAPFLKRIAEKGKPVILGTGMSTLKEVKEAVDTLRRHGSGDITALHCVTSYPCSPEDANLRAIVTLKEELACPVGYSDHTLSLITPVIAVALGAVVIEKHLTLDVDMAGPDHKASLGPEAFKEMAENIRNAEIIMGSAKKAPISSELEIMKTARKSIIAAKDIARGDNIAHEAVIIKRPGTGIEPKDLNKILNKKALRDIKKDTPINFMDIS